MHVLHCICCDSNVATSFSFDATTLVESHDDFITSNIGQ